MQTKKFTAHIDELYNILYWIRTEAAHIGFDRPRLNQLEIAVEEVIVNIINHASVDSLEIMLKPVPHKEMKVIILDGGSPFNPLLEEKKVDIHASLEEREVGGMGLVLIKSCVDEILYERQGAQNKLTLIKRLEI